VVIPLGPSEVDVEVFFGTLSTVGVGVRWWSSSGLRSTGSSVEVPTIRWW
jgi:hypothetical protein